VIHVRRVFTLQRELHILQVRVHAHVDA
jgi:hypothetical protein